MPFYLQMSKNKTQQRDIYDTVIFRFLQIFYIYINLFLVGIDKTPQKSDKAKVEQWIKKILKDTPNHEGGSCKKAKEGK